MAPWLVCADMINVFLLTETSCEKKATQVINGFITHILLRPFFCFVFSFSETIQSGHSIERPLLPGLWGGIYIDINGRSPLTLLYRFLEAKFTFVVDGRSCDPSLGDESVDCGRVHHWSQWHRDVWEQRDYCHQALEGCGTSDVCYPIWWRADSCAQQESLCCAWASRYVYVPRVFVRPFYYYYYWIMWYSLQCTTLFYFLKRWRY